MKWKDGNFIQLDRDLFKYKVSARAKWLYTVLTETEHRFTSGWEGRSYFWRAAEDLAADSGLSVKTIRKYRRELEKAGLIQTWKFHPPANSNNNGKGPCKKAAVIAFRLKR